MPPTEMWHTGTSEFELYEKYLVKHGFIYKMDGRLKDVEFDHCTRFERFPAYCHREKPWLLTAHVKGQVAQKAFDRLSACPTMTNMKVVPAKLDLPAAHSRLESHSQHGVKGGWFGGLKIDKVQVAYLYGDEVTDSEDWERYLSAGELKALHLEVSHGDGKLPILVSKDCVVVFYSTLSEREYLSYASRIFDLLEDLMK